MITIHVPPGTRLDELLRANRRAARFILSEGDYYLSGSPAFKDLDWCCLADGCELIGAGSMWTRIIPVGRIGKGPGQFEFLTAGSRSHGSGHVRIEGIRLEMPINPESFEDVYPEVLTVPSEIGRVGLHVWSDGSTIRDVAVNGVSGLEPVDGVSREGFGILVNNSRGELQFGSMSHRIEDCHVTLNRDEDGLLGLNFACGIYVGLKSPDAISTAHRCTVRSDSSYRAHAAFASNGGVVWSECSNRGRFDRAIYCDVTGGRFTRFVRCQLGAEAEAVTLAAGAGGAAEAWLDFWLDDCDVRIFDHADHKYSAFLVLRDLSPESGKVSFSRVGMRNCTLSNFRLNAPTYAGSWDAARTTECGLFGCRWVGKPMLPAQRGPKAPGSGFIAAVTRVDEA